MLICLPSALRELPLGSFTCPPSAQLGYQKARDGESPKGGWGNLCSGCDTMERCSVDQFRTPFTGIPPFLQVRKRFDLAPPSASILGLFGRNSSFPPHELSRSDYEDTKNLSQSPQNWISSDLWLASLPGIPGSENRHNH